MIGSSLARRSAGRRASEVQLVGIKYFRASQDASGRSISVASQRDEGDEFFDCFLDAPAEKGRVVVHLRVSFELFPVENLERKIRTDEHVNVQVNE